MPINKTLNHDFFKTWSVEMAYVLGYFAADGSMLNNSRGGYYIEFTSIDRILLENVQKVMGSNHKISVQPFRNEKLKTQYRLQIGSKTWFEDLTQLGFIQHKSNTLAFPDIPKEYIGHFIHGYFDGDGGVYFNNLKYSDRKYKRWVLLTMFTSGSQEFLKTLHSKLKENDARGGSINKKLVDLNCDSVTKIALRSFFLCIILLKSLTYFYRVNARN